MIKLTDVQDNAVYINPDRVIGIHLRDDVGTRVNYGGESYVVRESPEEVARKVLEWRLAMERYKVSYGIDIITPNETPESYKDEGYLRRLAGLEEPNHD